jgi:hypothetical protein
MAKGRIAELVSGYRATIAAHPDLYDGDELDSMILWLVSDTPERTWSPSETARAVGCTTSQAQCHLSDLARERYVEADDRGAWTHYWSRYR